MPKANPEVKLSNILKEPEKYLDNAEKQIGILNNGPRWVAVFLVAFESMDKVLKDSDIKKLASGGNKTVYALNGDAISIEEYEKNDDEKIYKKLELIEGCPKINYPDDVFIWAGIKFARLKYCPDGDLRDYFHKVNVNIPVSTMLKHLYEIGFSLLKVHKVGIYPTDIKPGNMLYCKCNGGYSLTLADLEGSVMEEYLYNGKIGGWKRKTQLEKGGYKVMGGDRMEFPCTAGYSLLPLSGFCRVDVSKMELIFNGWFAFAHTWLELYAYVTKDKAVESQILWRLYHGKHKDENGRMTIEAIDWRNIPKPKITMFTDFIALKMYNIIDAGCRFLKNEKTYKKMSNGIKVTKDSTVIDLKRWKNYYHKVILNEFNSDNKLTWYEDIKKEFIKLYN